jgi:hypothetical protein
LKTFLIYKLNLKGNDKTFRLISFLIEYFLKQEQTYEKSEKYLSI